MATNRRTRLHWGVESEYDRVDAAPVRAMLAGMRAEGLRWTQIEEVASVDRRALGRILGGRQTFVRRSTAERIAAARREFQSVPVARTHKALLIDATVSRWKVRSLMAQGHSSAWMGERTGLDSLGQIVQRSPLLQVKTVDVVDRLFEEAHNSWGPNRRTAVRMWRAGHFPVECYEWDQPVPDTRPIPGSLHPDLVNEAATFTHAHVGRTRSMKRFLTTLGQWSDERCAERAMAVWLRSRGEDVDEPSCPGGRKHLHSLPEMWAEPMAA